MAEWGSMKGQVALITGGGAYIGEAIALQLGKAGAAVMVAHPTIEEAKQVAAQIESEGGKSNAISFDASSSESVDAMVKATIDWGGRIDCVYQGQYTTGQLKTLADTTDEEWHSTVDVDLHGVFYLCRAVAQYMIKQKSGSILVPVSGRGIYGQKDYGAYGTSMAGVGGLVKTLQWELGEYGVTINGFSPGFVLAERTMKVWGDDKIARLRQAAPHKQLPSPENIADFAQYMFTQGRWMTGQIFMLATYTE
jgi:NAD(P)-dependent dehydrogenase (short-subunit alcohol dehydrogenase family)